MNIADVIVCLIGILLFVSQGAVIGIDDEDDSTFTITVDQKTFHFQGELKEEILSLHSPNCFFHFLLGCLPNEVLQLICMNEQTGTFWMKRCCRLGRDLSLQWIQIYLKRLDLAAIGD